MSGATRTEEADESMNDPVMLRRVIAGMLDHEELLYSDAQDYIEGDPELEEYARQLDFYMGDGTTEGAFK